MAGGSTKMGGNRTKQVNKTKGVSGESDNRGEIVWHSDKVANPKMFFPFENLIQSYLKQIS